LTQEDSQAMLAQSDRMVAAELLWAAERDRVPMAPVTSTYPGVDVAPGDSFRAEFSDIGSVSIQFK